MSTGKTLRLSKSVVERGTVNRIDGNKYADKLKSLDKNGDGELDMEEVIDAMEQMVRSEKQNRMLKYLIAALALFSLLTIAATVGLTYAVVALSKDTKVNSSNALVNKDTGETLKTGASIQSLDPFSLSQTLSKTNVSDFLAHLEAIKVPSNASDEVYTVHRIASASLLPDNAGIRVRTVGGDVINFYTIGAAASGGGENATVVVDEPMELESGARRRLAAFNYPSATDCTPFKPVSTPSPSPSPPSPTPRPPPRPGNSTKPSKKPKWNNGGADRRRRTLLGTFEDYTFTQASCDALTASLIAECGTAATKVHTYNAKAALEILKLQIENPSITLTSPEVTPYLKDICYTDAKDLSGNTRCLNWERENLGAYSACLSLYEMYAN